MIRTSYFANRAVHESELCPVAISLDIPPGYHCNRYPALAPTRAMIKLAHEGRTEEYTEQYTFQILSRLDAQKVYEELDGSVLLCWEKAGKFCHRRLVAEWLELATGNEVKEL
ncbi:MAG: DUF488 family protein [Synergistaceae bacterium]|nr:DUF488 family protein [Synergistaceae bacterium]